MAKITSPWHFFFNDLPLSAAKPFVDAIATTYYTGPMQLTSEAYRRAPMTALLCKHDKAMKPMRQEAMWSWLQAISDEEKEEEERYGHGDGDWAMVKEPRSQVEWIEACHTPWVSKADEVAAFLARTVGREDVSAWTGRAVVR
jgi:hypothetical protein